MSGASADPDERPRSLGEPAVVLTDTALGLESAAFAVMLAGTPVRVGSPLRVPLVTFFAATSAASLLGAALHGMSTDRTDPRRRALWRMSLTSIGVASLASWWLAARIALADTQSADVGRAATLAHVPYFALVLGSDQPYGVVVVWYLPAALAVGGALATPLGSRRYRRSARIGLIALGVTLLAAWTQVRRIGLGRHFDHNAVYHSLQAVGVALFFRATRGLMVGPAEPARHEA